MRVIAGKLGGRLFASPGSERTHPMSDKIRGALYNTLGSIEGLTVLDAFTGSGALAIEAISRGASQVTALDVDVMAINTVINNIAHLGVGPELKAIRASVASWLLTSPASTSFDLVLCDPPYDNPQLDLLVGLAEKTKPGGLLVLSLPPQAMPVLSASYELVTSKTYGDACLYFYRRAA